MLKENYLSTNLVYVSILHNKNRIQKYINKLDKVFKIIKRCENGESIKKYLSTQSCNPSFKRLTL